MMLDNLETNSILEKEMRYPPGINFELNVEQIECLAKCIIKEFGNKPINLFCAGGSGGIISGVVAFKYLENGGKCKINHVKKENEEAHFNEIVIDPEDNIIIIDDFSRTGNTVNYIYNSSIKSNTVNNRVDLLILSGKLKHNLNLGFEPKKIICGGIKYPLDLSRK
jgi:hypoxanthine phosphoribosyltransferase